MDKVGVDILILEKSLGVDKISHFRGGQIGVDMLILELGVDKVGVDKVGWTY